MARFAVLIELYARREAEARGRVAKLEAQRADLAARIAALELERQPPAEVHFALRGVYAAHWHRIGDAIHMVTAQLAACDKEIDVARLALVEAHRTTATFMKLRQRDLEAAAQRGERRQARRIDDLAATRAAQGRA